MRNYVLGSAITVLDLKKMIWEKTHVQPQRQKLLNLKLKGKPAPEEALLSNLDLKAGVSNKIMMMGSSEQGKKSLKIISGFVFHRFSLNSRRTKLFFL